MWAWPVRGRSVVVPPATDGVAGEPEQCQDQADGNDDDADRPDNGDPGDEADDEEYYAENDHLGPSWLFALSSWTAAPGRSGC
jgi:hypothetical protein